MQTTETYKGLPDSVSEIYRRQEKWRLGRSPLDIADSRRSMCEVTPNWHDILARRCTCTRLDSGWRAVGHNSTQRGQLGRRHTIHGLGAGVSQCCDGVAFVTKASQQFIHRRRVRHARDCKVEEGDTRGSSQLGRWMARPCWTGAGTSGGCGSGGAYLSSR